MPSGLTKVSGMKMSKNLLERALWTLAQAAVGVVAVLAADVPVAYAPLVAAALSVVKTYVKEKLDGRSSAEV